MSHIATQKDQTGRPADADNNLARGAPGDREERIQQKRRNDREGAIGEKPEVPQRRGKT
jgi:hypothetical protein